MIMKNGKQIGFIYKNGKKIDKIIRHGKVYFEQGFTREQTDTTLPIAFDGVGKDLKNYRVYGNTYQNSTSGKNLLNYVDNIISVNGLTNVINDDGSITTTGVPTSNYVGILTQHNIIDKLEDGQIYTISSETQNQYVYIQINAVKIAGGTDYIYNNNNRAVQFTVDKSKYSKYNLKIQVGTTSAWGTNSRTITNKYQLEKGATATEFEPYTNGVSPNPDYPQEIVSCGDLITDSQDKNYGKYKIPVNINNSITNIYLDEPLRKIDGYSDYIDFISGKVVRNIKEKTFNGSESWYSYNQNLYLENITDYKKGSNYIPLCTHYKGANQTKGIQTPTTNNNKTIRFSNNDATDFYRLFVIDTDFNNSSSFKTWLESNNIIIDYILTTPIQKSIELPNIPTINGNNTLNIETEITPSQVYIKYKSNN